MRSCAMMEKRDGFLEIHQKVNSFYVTSKPRDYRTGCCFVEVARLFMFFTVVLRIDIF